MGEKFFIDSVVHFADEIDDPRLREEVAAFREQEATHRVQHQKYNELLCRLRDGAAFMATLKMNGDLFIRALFLTTAFAFFTAQSAEFGTTVMAANAILMNLLTITAYGLDGFAIAAEALVG